MGSPIPKLMEASRTLWSKRWARRVAELALFALALVAMSAWQTRDVVRGVLPEFSLPMLHGTRMESASFRGKSTMLVVWAPWCGVCGAESQNVSWAKALLGDRVRVMSLAAHYQDVREVEEFARAHNVDYPILLGGRDAHRLLGVQSFPTILFLDDQGRVERAAVGYTTTIGLMVRALL